MTLGFRLARLLEKRDSWSAALWEVLIILVPGALLHLELEIRYAFYIGSGALSSDLSGVSEFCAQLPGRSNQVTVLTNNSCGK